MGEYTSGQVLEIALRIKIAMNKRAELRGEYDLVKQKISDYNKQLEKMCISLSLANDVVDATVKELEEL